MFLLSLVQSNERTALEIPTSIAEYNFSYPLGSTLKTSILDRPP